ncbi:DUF262 domain-containing protein [Specibacter cremeus]|uniref:DUF262 domain-containing protein n=1 Tax=Specibacter cremeus TaxID=1629051 RepID=UPI000F7933C1|nr:DUF262 domain-containing protein [Specibacter cremeus]
MIDSVKACAVSSLLGVDNKIVYLIPPYQREYTWNKPNWENLLDDVLDSPGGYFLGSIICINQQRDATDVATLELVDGQQRVTTLSILLAALYASLAEHADTFDLDDNTELSNLKRKLVLKSPKNHVRLSPQRQSNNNADYEAVLAAAGVIPARPNPANLGNRRIMKAFRYFREQLAVRAGEPGVSVAERLFEFVELVSAAVLVKIEVKTHSDAYVLFESLNNRGAQLTPIDLIKNKLLATTHGQDADAVDQVFGDWRRVIELLGDDYSQQERFFRQYYNAFKPELEGIVNEAVATKSNLIRIYEKLIEHGSDGLMARLINAAEIYSRIALDTDEEATVLDRALASVRRAQGSPSYLLLMYLMTNQQRLELSTRDLADICRLLVAFFVRRNVTGLPATYELQRTFMAITRELGEDGTGSVHGLLRDRLTALSTSDDHFREKLRGHLYEDSRDMARFILASLAESTMTDETRVNLWAMADRTRRAWSVEHIFPQGANIPAAWVDAMGGDAESAKAVQANLVHTLGNLTITRFNSNLSNKPFAQKLSVTDGNGLAVGLKNNLSINDDVVSQTAWTEQHILDRRERLVEKTLAHFSMN